MRSRAVNTPLLRRVILEPPFKILIIGPVGGPKTPAHPIIRILIKSMGGGLKSQTAQYFITFHPFPARFHPVSKMFRLMTSSKTPNTSSMFRPFPARFHLVSDTSRFRKRTNGPIRRQFFTRFRLVSTSFPTCVASGI